MIEQLHKILDRLENNPTELYVAQIPSDEKTRSVLCRLWPVNDGGMFEFLDAQSGLIVGSVGRNNLADTVKPLSELVPDQEIAHDPESRRYIWLDANGVRCSPRHIKITAALNYKRSWEPNGETQRWASIGSGPERSREKLPAAQGHLPSLKEPVKLVVIYEVVRELTDDESIGVRQLENLIEKGWI